MLPFGGFLDSLPPALFVAAHLMFLMVGGWLALRDRTGAGGRSALWLYVGSQVVFLAFFGGLLTLKMSVLIEQTLMLLMLVLVFGPARPETSSTMTTANSAGAI
jgi:hypothetical protein